MRTPCIKWSSKLSLFSPSTPYPLLRLPSTLQLPSRPYTLQMLQPRRQPTASAYPSEVHERHSTRPVSRPLAVELSDLRRERMCEMDGAVGVELEWAERGAEGWPGLAG